MSTPLLAFKSMSHTHGQEFLVRFRSCFKQPVAYGSFYVQANECGQSCKEILTIISGKHKVFHRKKNKLDVQNFRFVNTTASNRTPHSGSEGFHAVELDLSPQKVFLSCFRGSSNKTSFILILQCLACGPRSHHAI